MASTGFAFGASQAGPKLAAVAPLSSAGSSSTLGSLNLSVPPQTAFGTAGTGAADAASVAAASGTPGAAGGSAAAGQSSTIVGLNLSSTTPFSFAPNAATAGQQQQQQQSAFGFSASPAAAAAKPAAPAFGLGLGAAANSASKAPGGATAPAATQSSTIGGLNLSSTTTFSMAAPAAKPPLGLSFGTAPAANAAPGLGSGNFSFGALVTTAGGTPATAGLAVAAAAPAAATAFRGLGGVPGSSLPGGGVGGGIGGAAGSGAAGVSGFGIGGAGGTAGSSGAAEVKSVLESEIPHEVLATVEAFRRHLTSQRELRARMEAERAGLAQELGRVAEEAESVAQSVRRLATSRAASIGAAVRLRGDLAELGQQLSVARRSFELPAWQQAESQEALELLGRLVTEAGGKIRLLKAEIEDLEAALCLDGSGGRVSGQELLNALRQAREALVACAAELGATCSACDRLRANFLAYRRARGDFRNPFADFAEQSAPRAASSSGGRRSGFGPPPCDDSLAAAAAAAATAAAAASVTQPAAVAPSLFGGIGGGGFGGFSAFSAAAPAAGGTGTVPSLFGGFGGGAGTAGFGIASLPKRKPDGALG